MENGRRNHFIINPNESMGPGWDRTPEPGSAVGLATNCTTGPDRAIWNVSIYLSNYSDDVDSPQSCLDQQFS